MFLYVASAEKKSLTSYSSFTVSSYPNYMLDTRTLILKSSGRFFPGHRLDTAAIEQKNI